jgi:hypothetical protein
MKEKMVSNKNVTLRTLTLNGPALGLGMLFSLVGLLCTFAGFGTQNINLIFFSLIFFCIGFLGMITIECLVLDVENNTLKLYTDYFVFKPGKLYKLDKFSGIKIIYEFDSIKQNKINPTLMAASATWNPTQFKSFDIYLIGVNEDEVKIKHFADIKKAKEFQNLISNLTGYTILEASRRLTKRKK